MEIKLQKWGNNLGLCIPPEIADRLGLDENTLVELSESEGVVAIAKKSNDLSLDALLASIPADFKYPEDVLSFSESEPLGQEMI